MGKDRKEYLAEYKKKNYCNYTISVSKENEDVIRRLNRVENKTQYIISLIEKDIKRIRRKSLKEMKENERKKRTNK